MRVFRNHFCNFLYKCLQFAHIMIIFFDLTVLGKLQHRSCTHGKHCGCTGKSLCTVHDSRQIHLFPVFPFSFLNKCHSPLPQICQQDHCRQADAVEIMIGWSIDIIRHSSQCTDTQEKEQLHLSFIFLFRIKPGTDSHYCPDQKQDDHTHIGTRIHRQIQMQDVHHIRIRQ